MSPIVSHHPVRPPSAVVLALLGAAWLLAPLGCTVGEGTGAAKGKLYLKNCSGTAKAPTGDLGSLLVPADFDLNPNFFVGEPIEDIKPMGSDNRLVIRMQDAGKRVGRYLIMQLVVNIVYAIPIAIGLWVLGIPNALLWGLLALALRFVPYIGPAIGALLPLFGRCRARKASFGRRHQRRFRSARHGQRCAWRTFSSAGRSPQSRFETPRSTPSGPSKTDPGPGNGRNSLAAPPCLRFQRRR